VRIIRTRKTVETIMDALDETKPPIQSEMSVAEVTAVYTEEEFRERLGLPTGCAILEISLRAPVTIRVSSRSSGNMRDA
jgi:hypothetical protein